MDEVRRLKSFKASEIKIRRLKREKDVLNNNLNTIKLKKVYHLESMQTNLIENLVHMATVTEWMPPIIRVAKPVAENKNHLLTDVADLKLEDDPITT